MTPLIFCLIEHSHWWVLFLFRHPNLSRKTRKTTSLTSVKSKANLGLRYQQPTQKGMTCAIDTGWQKRGFDSLTGWSADSKFLFLHILLNHKINHCTFLSCLLGRLVMGSFLTFSIVITLLQVILSSWATESMAKKFWSRSFITDHATCVSGGKTKDLGGQ